MRLWSQGMLKATRLRPVALVRGVGTVTSGTSILHTPQGKMTAPGTAARCSEVAWEGAEPLRVNATVGFPM